MQLFYNPELTATDKIFAFSKEESKHIVKVLRKKEGDILSITNGKGDFFKAEISFATIKICEITILSHEFHQDKPYEIHLVVAPTKMNDRYEWLLEKATEIGLTSITPIICDHSERKNVKIERFTKIVQSAMKQSLHFYMPTINEPVKFKDFIKETHQGQTFIAHCEETNKKSFKTEIQPNTPITILIGPEGDFSTNEIDLAIKHNFKPVTLGKTRLRTETAALVACHSVAFINE